MRIIEILILGTLILALTANFRPAQKRPSWTNFLPGIAILFILIHLHVEGYRWQMVPAYTLAMILFVLSIPSLLGEKITPSTGRGRRILSGVGKAAGFMLLVLAAALSTLFPVFKMPDPTGPYAVGTTSFAFTDDSRPEIFTPSPEDKRLVYVQVWYPAHSTADSTPTPMWIDPEKITSMLAKAFLPSFMPDFLFDHLPLLESNSYLNVPLAEQEAAFPILVFSHGHAEGFFAQNMVQMEELASHGYVIFSVGHAYESAMVFDAQGRTVSMSETQVTAFNNENEETNELFQHAFYATGDEQLEAARTWLAASPVAQLSIQIWTQDMQFALTQIEFMNRGQLDSPFAGHLDTARIGVFGQSFGGAAAFQVCAIDSRCKASINMDGSQWGTLMDDPLQTPFLMMYNEKNDRANDWALNISPAHGYSIRVNGASHINFTDFNLISSVFKHPQVGILGNIDPQQMEQIMNAYTLAFFDHTLKGIPSPLLQAVSPDYPEVELKIFR